ncbi:pyruvate formate-lyase-activating protein [Paenibacillus lemnae]|uniref:Pyruvate formate-lyase-activating enzyme n=1 Tax=Paenibacillus lemnae TaxID=1330551 RepID=A0A848M9K9_PAELE|nr:pyruvate formate-lyase-activating protein [Paenibacillus lemnae]NMO96850.1 pyruvate formate lyase-activating protein [Paenibacillus lemnae]
MLKGHVHSMETFGTVDGPGIRFVLFMQGCLLKCKYCHNPDTWGLNEGIEMSVEDVLAEIEPYLPYYRSSGGGLTVSGGEPTLQHAFVTRLFQEVKRRWNLHTALDTNGFNDPDKIRELLLNSDLVLLDLKHIDEKKHILLTGKSNERTLRLARWLSDHQRPVWIRHVYVPGIHHEEDDLVALGQYVCTLACVEKFEILPFHQLGIHKWEALGRAYPLKDVDSPSEEEIQRAYSLIHKGSRLSLKPIDVW